jgi:hypothetical protein
MKHKKDKLYKMARANYTFEDFYCDLGRYQFTEDNDVLIGLIIKDDVKILRQFWSECYVNYGKDYFILHSLYMWKPFTFDKVKDNLVIVDVDKENIYIHDGQYIINYQDPYGQKGR